MQEVVLARGIFTARRANTLIGCKRLVSAYGLSMITWCFAISSVMIKGLTRSAATDRAVAVTITPIANHEAITELALAMMFSLVKNVAVVDPQILAGQCGRRRS